MEPRTYPVFVLIFFTAPLMLGIIFLLEEDVSRKMKKVLRKLEMDVIKNNNAIMFSMEIQKRKMLHEWLLDEIAKKKIEIHLCYDPRGEAKVHELTQLMNENAGRLREIEEGSPNVSKEDEVNELLNRLLHLGDFDESDRSGRPSV